MSLDLLKFKAAKNKKMVGTFKNNNYRPVKFPVLIKSKVTNSNFAYLVPYLFKRGESFKDISTANIYQVNIPTTYLNKTYILVSWNLERLGITCS